MSRQFKRRMKRLKEKQLKKRGVIIDCMFDKLPCDRFAEVGGFVEPYVRLCSGGHFGGQHVTFKCPRSSPGGILDA